MYTHQHPQQQQQQQQQLKNKNIHEKKEKNILWQHNYTASTHRICYFILLFLSLLYICWFGSASNSRRLQMNSIPNGANEYIVDSVRVNTGFYLHFELIAISYTKQKTKRNHNSMFTLLANVVDVCEKKNIITFPNYKYASLSCSTLGNTEESNLSMLQLTRSLIYRKGPLPMRKSIRPGPLLILIRELCWCPFDTPPCWTLSI